MRFTSQEQHRINRCYADIKAALDELALIKQKDYALVAVQRKLYGIEDTLHQYVGPSKEAQ